jgi:hypothetical protein
MKRLFFFLLIGIVVLSSCNKDKSTAKTIEGTYYMDKAFRNGADFTGFFNLAFPNYKLELKSASNFIESHGNTSSQGKWEVTDKGTKLMLRHYDGSNRPYDIEDFSNSTLDVKEIDGDGNTNLYKLKKY